MSAESNSRGHMSAENIREVLEAGGYQYQCDGKSTSMPRNEALLFAIEHAAEYDHLDLIQELVAEGAALSLSTGPLIAACEAGHIHIVKYLIQNGTDINGRGRLCGETPLMAAAGCGKALVVKYLLENGADPTMRDTEPDAMDSLAWAKIGYEGHGWLDGMPEDVCLEYQQVISMLSSLK